MCVRERECVWGGGGEGGYNLTVAQKADRLLPVPSKW